MKLLNYKEYKELTLNEKINLKGLILDEWYTSFYTKLNDFGSRVIDFKYLLKSKNIQDIIEVNPQFTEEPTPFTSGTVYKRGYEDDCFDWEEIDHIDNINFDEVNHQNYFYMVLTDQNEWLFYEVAIDHLKNPFKEEEVSEVCKSLTYEELEEIEADLLAY